MVRMKLRKDEFDPNELDVEYEGPQFERYTGDVPKTGTILIHRVTKAWWKITEDGDNQMVILAVAEQNKGDLKEFNGLTTWEYLTWKPSSSRRYQPFLQLFGITLRDVMTKMDVAEDDDNIGTPINSIGDWEVGSDDALARIVIKRDYWNEEWRAKIDWDGWLPFDIDADADDDDDDDEEEEQDQRPARTRKAKPASKPAAARSRRRAEPEPDEDEDEDVDDEEDVDDYEDDDEDEEDEVQETPRRSSRAASSPARSTARPARSAAKATGRSAGRSSARTAARPAARTASKPKGRSRAAAADDDEPPF